MRPLSVRMARGCGFTQWLLEAADCTLLPILRLPDHSRSVGPWSLAVGSGLLDLRHVVVDVHPMQP